MLYVVVTLAAFACLGVVSIIGIAFIVLGVLSCLQREPGYGLVGIALGALIGVLMSTMMAMIAKPMSDIGPRRLTGESTTSSVK